MPAVFLYQQKSLSSNMPAGAFLYQEIAFLRGNMPADIKLNSEISTIRSLRIQALHHCPLDLGKRWQRLGCRGVGVVLCLISDPKESLKHKAERPHFFVVLIC